jgi:acyl-CoA thioester hydrolase
MLTGFPVTIELPVLWGDEDAFGHVNNLSYLRWCETARVDYLRRMDLFPELPPKGVGPILASIKCDYRMPLNYPDTVRVGTRITSIGNSSFRMEHRVVSAKLNEVAADVESVMVLLDYDSGRPVPVPAEFRKCIGDLEGKDFLNGPA